MWDGLRPVQLDDPACHRLRRQRFRSVAVRACVLGSDINQRQQRGELVCRRVPRRIQQGQQPLGEPERIVTRHKATLTISSEHDRPIALPERFHAPRCCRCRSGRALQWSVSAERPRTGPPGGQETVRPESVYFQRSSRYPSQHETGEDGLAPQEPPRMPHVPKPDAQEHPLGPFDVRAAVKVASRQRVATTANGSSAMAT